MLFVRSSMIDNYIFSLFKDQFASFQKITSAYLSHMITMKITMDKTLILHCPDLLYKNFKFRLRKLWRQKCPRC